MTRAVELGATIGTALLLWAFLLWSDFVWNWCGVDRPMFRTEILPALPFWALVAFGAYALGSLGIDLMTFKDKPEKYAELMNQVEEAKADLKSKGIKF